MRPLLALLLGLTPTLTEARPCQLPSAARSFQLAAASPLFYAVIHGQFDTDATGRLIQPFHLTGQRLTPSGFTTRFSEPVTYSYVCPKGMEGCPTYIRAPEPAQGPVLAFIEITDQGYVLTEQGCWSETVVANPSLQDLATVTACIRGEPCQ